jgi:putative exporter of polyketide antibiotics
MKILSMIGIILMIGGSLLALYGYELCAHFFCLGLHCPSCEEAVPISRLTVFTGIAVTLGGVGFLVYSRRSISS